MHYFYASANCVDYVTYRVRGVDGSCAEHLTVESYTVFIYTSLFAQIAATKEIKQHTKLTNNYDKSKNLLNTALRSWRTVLIFICQQSYLLLFCIPSPTHSFIPGLKPSFSANPSHRSPSFLPRDAMHPQY